MTSINHQEDAQPDIVEQARQAQLRQEAKHTGSIKVIAPAKVNLFLRIGNKRADGYHEALSVMHALSLHDVVYMNLSAADEGAGLVVDVDCTSFEGLPDIDVPTEDNLACKAVRLLASLVDRTVDEAMTIAIDKHIPAQAGLGGGSSDAAAALVGAAHLWGIDASDSRLTQAARELGADVAFFLHGGCAVLSGVGDSLDRTITPMGNPVVLIKPEGGVSTAQAYAQFDACPQAIPDNIYEAAQQAMQASDVPWANNLAEAAEELLPVLKEVNTWLEQQQGVVDYLMSGSGSACFAICSSLTDASKLAAAARAQGWWARTTTFSAIRAAVQPTR